MFNIKRLFALAAPMAATIIAGSIAHAQSPGCYTLESLHGSYAVANTYGANVALGLQAEDLDGKGNLTRTGILNQPTAGSATGERTVGTVTSNGTYTVNCNGAGTITRIVTRPDGSTAAASDDILITEASEQGGRLIAITFVDVQRDPSVILPGGVFLTRVHTRRPSVESSRCYTLDSLQGSYGVIVNYGANVALGLQPEFLDGKGNLTRTGINNQPTAGSAAGARMITSVNSTGTYTVNCNGTGTITRVVTRADGTTASASDDFIVTGAADKDGRLIATTIMDAQRDPSVIVAGGIFVTRTHTRRQNAGPDATSLWESQLQSLACGSNPPVPSCQVTLSVWNYYLTARVNSNAPPVVVGDGTQLMTVQQYLSARAAAGL